MAPNPDYDPAEKEIVNFVFSAMLKGPTNDGGNKRASNRKPPWWADEGHEAGLFSHIAKWKKGQKVDPESRSHPLVHAAWRCLAIAYQETEGKIPPEVKL